MTFWKERRVTITGGGGFLGSFVVAKLQENGCQNVCAARSKDYDLREPENVLRLYKDSRPDIVVHLAATVGGIGANRKHPGRFFYDTAIMGIQMMEYARRFNVEKFVSIGTVCSYPKFTPTPFHEENLWEGYPEETNAPYGLAKKMMLVQMQAYREEYNFPGIYLIPVNLYGPRDNFDLESSHVIPALISKFVQAQASGSPAVSVWGSGNATREFLYVEDAAEAIVLAAEKYGKAEPVNLGSGQEISIYKLAYLIKELTGYEGAVEWDSSKPDGQPRRSLDISRAQKEFGWHAKTDFRQGLQKTIQWYLENQ